MNECMTAKQYKAAINDMVSQIENVKLLSKIYSFTKAYLKAMERIKQEVSKNAE